jgi:hypothetical protein
MAKPDFRSKRSATPEGQGIARRAWDSYAAVTNRTLGPVLHPILDPVMDPAAKRIARDWVGDLLGFYVLWHLYGGFEGLERFGMHRATIFRKVNRFRQVFGVHPDEWKMDGINIDAEAYWTAEGKKVGPQPRPSEA